MDLRAAELLLVTSSPVTAFTRGGPASAMEPRPFTIGTKSARPGMYAVPAAPGPIIAATCGTTPLMITCSRNRCPVPANSEPGRLLDPRAGRVDEPDDRIRFVSAISRRRVTFSSPVLPMVPPLTVKS